MELADVILGHYDENRGFMPRMPILVLECSKEVNWKGGMLKTLEIFPGES